MRIAVCFSGALRTFKLCYEDVIAHFKKLGHVDVFISTWEKPCYTRVNKDTDIHAIKGTTVFTELLDKDAIITEEYLQSITTFAVIDIEDMDIMQRIIDTAKDMKTTIMPPSRLILQYYKMDRCNRLKKLYEKKHAIKYDINVRIRTDIKIQSIPQNIDTRKIYINKMVWCGYPISRAKYTFEAIYARQIRWLIAYLRRYPVYRRLFAKLRTIICNASNSMDKLNSLLRDIELGNLMNEMIFIADNRNMDRICSIYSNFKYIWQMDVDRALTRAGCGERVSYKHFMEEI